MSTPPSNAPTLVLDDDPRLRDTGWRDVTTLLTSGWAKSSLLGRALLRRHGDRVEFDARLVPVSATVGASRTSASPVLTLLAGWFPRNDHLLVGQWFVYAAGPQGPMRVSGGSLQTQAAGGTPGTWGAADLVVVHGEWTTDQAFPTTFPGTPA